MKIKIVLLVFLALMFQSCDVNHTPENYFDRAVLNINAFATFGSKDLNEIVFLKEQNRLMGRVDGKFITQGNAELHVTSWKIVDTENKIKGIKELKSTEETKVMLDRSLAFFNFILERYKTEYLDIAKLIDNGAPQSEIDTAIANFDNTYATKFEELYNNVIEVGMPYAKANGIEVSY